MTTQCLSSFKAFLPQESSVRNDMCTEVGFVFFRGRLGGVSVKSQGCYCSSSVSRKPPAYEFKSRGQNVAVTPPLPPAKQHQFSLSFQQFYEITSKDTPFE